MGKNKEISMEQYGALLWAGALAPAVELLPTVTLPAAGRGAWLSTLAAAVVLLPFFYKVKKLGGSILGAREELGRWGGSIFLLLYVLWLELLLCLRLGLCARRMLLAGERDGSVWFFLVGVAVLALWMGLGSLSAFARAGQIFLTVLVFSGGLVLALSLPQVRVDRLLPLWKGDVRGILGSAVPAAGCLLWSILPMLCLPPEDDRRWGMVRWGVGGCAALTGMQAILLGNLGGVLAAGTGIPFFTLSKSVGVEGAFQRVESLVAALWLLADLTLVVGLLFAIRRLGGVLLDGREHPGLGAAALGVALWGAGVWCARGEAVEQWNQSWVLGGNLVLGFGGTTLLYLGGLVRRKVRGGSIFSGMDGKKNGTSGGDKKV